MTPRQADALEAIHKFHLTHGFSPSYADLAKALGLASMSGVARLVRALDRGGYIRFSSHRARSIEIIRRPTGTHGFRAEIEDALAEYCRQGNLEPETVIAEAVAAYLGVID